MCVQQSFILFLVVWFKKICFVFDWVFNFSFYRKNCRKKDLIMAVVENGELNVNNLMNQSESLKISEPKSMNFQMGVKSELKKMNGSDQMSLVKLQNGGNGVRSDEMNGEDDLRSDVDVDGDGDHHDGGDDGGEGFKKEMRDLEEMLSKLNPMAKEFVPPSITGFRPVLQPPQFGYIADGNFVVHTNSPVAAGGNIARRVI